MIQCGPAGVLWPQCFPCDFLSRNPSFLGTEEGGGGGGNVFLTHRKRKERGKRVPDSPEKEGEGENVPDSPEKEEEGETCS